ncbi:MAG: hypothetical protein AAFS11_00045 [Planctomycetota bacterium]
MPKGLVIVGKRSWPRIDEAFHALDQACFHGHQPKQLKRPGPWDPAEPIRFVRSDQYASAPLVCVGATLVIKSTLQDQWREACPSVWFGEAIQVGHLPLHSLRDQDPDFWWDNKGVGPNDDLIESALSKGSDLSANFYSSVVLARSIDHVSADQAEECCIDVPRDRSAGINGGKVALLPELAEKLGGYRHMKHVLSADAFDVVADMFPLRYFWTHRVEL